MIRTGALESVLALAVERHGRALVTLCSFQKEESVILAHWTERDLRTRIHERGLPYHPLHDTGYASIGCAPCTDRGDGREGCWGGTDKTECGLHV